MRGAIRATRPVHGSLFRHALLHVQVFIPSFLYIAGESLMKWASREGHVRALAGVLQPMLGTVNMVSAPVVAKERGIKVDEVRQSRRGKYETYIRFTVKTDELERSVTGTVFLDGRPRIIQIKGIDLEAEFGPHMLYVTNQDRPGFIGALGTLLGNAKVNIATFNLGREAQGGEAICLVQIDEPIADDVLKAVRALPQVKQAKPLAF